MGISLVGGFTRGGAMPAMAQARLTSYHSVNITLVAANPTQTLFQIRVDSGLKPYTLPSQTNQARGFDQWMLLYQRYRIKRVKITVTTTFAAGSVAEVQDADANMFLRYAIRPDAVVPVLTDTLRTIFERKRDMVRRFSINETGQKVIRHTFVIDPYAIVKASSERLMTRSKTGWAIGTETPSYEDGVLPHFDVQLHKVGANFPTSVEVFSEIHMVFDFEFKEPVQLAAS